MSEPEITVYGAYWCPDCRRSKQFLGEHQAPYGWVDIEEDEEGERFVIDLLETPEIGGNPQVRQALGTLTPVVQIREIRTQDDLLLIALQAIPTGLPAVLQSLRGG